MHQEHLLQYLEDLDASYQKQLTEEILSLPEEKVLEMQKCLKHPLHERCLSFEPFLDYVIAGNDQYILKGEKILKEGKAGCLIVAGGQGTRLGMPKNASKGTFPITIVKKKSLFQLFAEKTKAASLFAGKQLPIAIMTSLLNHDSVVAHFRENDYFGLDEEQVSFFSQETYPFLDDHGKLFLESPNHLAKGPCGNGYALSCFYKSAIWQKWKEKNISYISFVQIDNALADPFSAELLGFHVDQNNEVSIKCAKRQEESVGVLVKQNGHCRVIEYFEFPKKEWQAKKSDGSFLHECANLSLFCFDRDFIEKVTLYYCIQMPYHPVKKSSNSFVKRDGQIYPIKKESWKFEKFIFDCLPFASRIGAILFPREHCFAPLKNSEGCDSIDTVHALLQQTDVNVYKKVTGTTPPQRTFELAQEFYYPTSELLQKWKNKPLPDAAYIEP